MSDQKPVVSEAAITPRKQKSRAGHASHHATAFMKSRIVSFRLSEAEYSAVEQISQRQGCASVALFARSATLVGSCGGADGSTRSIDTGKLWQSLQAITVALDTVAATLHVVLRALGEPKTAAAAVTGGSNRPMEFNLTWHSDGSAESRGCRWGPYQAKTSIRRKPQPVCEKGNRV
jgi:hypothetical protein